MGTLRSIALGLAVLVTCLATSLPAWADDPATGPQLVPLEEPPGPDFVPVPDVRGMTEAEARDALTESGLIVGGVERVAKVLLEQTYGQTYEYDMVVQQAPAPSAAEKPTWLKRGKKVWLRLAVPPDQAAPLPPVGRPPAVVAPGSARPGAALPGAALPGTPDAGTRYYGELTFPRESSRYTAPAGSVPGRPPPPYGLGGTPTRTSPGAIAPGPVPPQPGRTIRTTRAPTPQATPATTKDPCCFTLSCDRNEPGWHFRALAGGAFWLGPDSGSAGLYAGADVGYTLCSCFGIDIFYRYAGGTFDRDLPNGLLEDSGDWHTLGVKATLDKTFSKGSRWYWSLGLGLGYFESKGYQENDDGIAGFGEFSVGYLLSNSIRARLGVNVHAMDSWTGRKSPADVESGRLLWIIAPTLGIEIDF